VFAAKESRQAKFKPSTEEHPQQALPAVTNVMPRDN
jgi:hypothetical protein